ncbi:MAG: DUF2281 domain-containing protein [Candidatus Cloacimonetes bacterium]|nr:DUF2281 domain-containing protein [Candidatus Cloacimonadota bacterium]
MSNLHKNYVNDLDLFTKAQVKLNDLGIDLHDAVEDYLKMILNSDNNQLMATLKSNSKNKKTMKDFRGILKGKIWIADDFDAPLDDMKDYME